MIREVERKKKLPAFSISLADLEVLFNKVSALFENREKIYFNITIALPNEKLEFDNLQELKNYNSLNGKITNFRIFLRQERKKIYVSTSSYFSEAYATSDSEAWCSSAVETIYMFLQNKKVWYHWIASARLGFILVILLNFPGIIFLFQPDGSSIPKYSLLGLFFAMITLVFLFFFRKKLFPTSILILTKEKSFIRKYSTELGLLLAIVSIILTIIGWFVRQ